MLFFVSSPKTFESLCMVSEAEAGIVARIEFAHALYCRVGLEIEVIGDIEESLLNLCVVKNILAE